MAMIRQMIRALDMLAPYQSQIGKVCWFGNKTEITVYLLEVIVARLLPNLVEKAFMDAEEKAQTQLSELLSVANAPRFDTPRASLGISLTSGAIRANSKSFDLRE
jgi:hypothetical protein